MKVKVVKARRQSYWYSNRIGEKFEVLDKIYLKRSRIQAYRLKDDATCLIDVDDVDVGKEKVMFT